MGVTLGSERGSNTKSRVWAYAGKPRGQKKTINLSFFSRVGHPLLVGKKLKHGKEWGVHTKLRVRGDT